MIDKILDFLTKTGRAINSCNGCDGRGFIPTIHQTHQVTSCAACDGRGYVPCPVR